MTPQHLHPITLACALAMAGPCVWTREMRNERSPLGVWRKTDALGRVSIVAPLPGRWVLRGTDLRLSKPDLWVSRFVTLVFAGRACGHRGTRAYG